MKIQTTTLAVLLALAGSAQAADLAAGRTIAKEQCAACHGETGAGDVNPLYPKLAGQHADYLIRALEDYGSGARINQLMVGFATALDAADRKNVAAWYASQADGVHTMSTD